MLNIRVIGKASDVGELDVLCKTRGEHGALERIVLELKGHGYTDGKVIIAHCGNPAAAERLMHMVKAVFEGAQVRVTECGGCAATTPSWAASWWASRTRTPDIKPLPLGEVALRSNDGEGKPVPREPPRSDKLSLCQSDAIAAPALLRQRPCPLRRSAPAPPKGEPLPVRLNYSIRCAILFP